MSPFRALVKNTIDSENRVVALHSSHNRSRNQSERQRLSSCLSAWLDFENTKLLWLVPGEYASTGRFRVQYSVDFAIGVRSSSLTNHWIYSMHLNTFDEASSRFLCWLLSRGWRQPLSLLYSFFLRLAQACTSMETMSMVNPAVMRWTWMCFNS